MQHTEKPISCLIVDDNEIARLILKQLLTQIPTLQLIGECSSAIEASNFINITKVDILFLDIEMPEMTGFDLLKALNPAPITILTSSSKAYVEEAYEMNVADYLIKPVNLPRLSMALQRATELLAKKEFVFNKVENEHVFIKENKSLRKLLIDDIYWLEAKGDYVKIQLLNKYHIIHSTLKQLEEKLPKAKFVKIHRSYIVAFEKIEYIEDNLVYANNSALPISESFKADLILKLNFL